jgi:hypothetical protein
MPRSRRIDPDVEEIDDVEEEAAEEDAAPRRRRRNPAAAEVEEAKPVRRRRPVEEDVDADEDEDEEEEKPAPRRRRPAKVEEDEEEAKPVRRRSAKPKDDEDYDEDSDEDSAVIPISRGRKEIKKNRPTSEASLAFFRWDEEPQLIKFLDNEPWSYDQHWVTRDGKQSFPCIGKGCPLCAIGVKVSQKIVYPILNLTPPKGDDFLTQSMEVGPTLDDTLVSHDASTKTGPLTRLWWSVSRTEGARSTGKRKKYNYVFTPVKDRDLEEDWEIDLDEAEDAAAAAKIPSPKEVLGEWNRSQLQEIADEAMGHS